MLAPDGNKPDYQTLEQALEEKLIQINELDTQGSVPELKLKNLDKKSVLIVEGEELVITSATKSKEESHPSIGLGTNVTFESRTASGSALVEGHRVLHLSAFRKEKRGNSNGVGYQRFSQRRRRR